MYDHTSLIPRPSHVYMCTCLMRKIGKILTFFLVYVEKLWYDEVMSALDVARYQRDKGPWTKIFLVVV